DRREETGDERRAIAIPGPTPLPDPHSGRAAGLRRRLPGPGDRPPARSPAAGHGPAHPVRLRPAVAAPRLRSAERPHLRLVALPAAAHQLGGAGGARRGGDDRQQVRPPRPRQARLQSHQLRHRGHDAGDRPGVGVAGPVGERRLLRLPPRVPGRPGGEPGGAQRRHLRLPRLLPGGPLRARPLARPAGRHPTPPARERRVPDLHLLHDLRSQDHARFAGRTRALRPAHRPGSGLRPLRALPAQRPHPLPRFPLAGRAADRPAAARPAVRLARDRARGIDLRTPSPRKENRMKRLPIVLLAAAAVAATTGAAFAFCGFYVAKADTKLFNQASQVVLVRDGDRTVLTMSNDFKGDPQEFAIVIPVPTFIQREQIHVADKALLDHLDAYSSPRLVEYFDENPCERRLYALAPQSVAEGVAGGAAADRAKSLGVTIEAQYTVGEYDILILSAKESSGLETWLVENGYRIPPGASRVLGSYLKQGMRFFVAKVNLKEQSKLGFTYLRPLQVAYESPKFMLPIRLGMVNANGPQELFIYALTPKGRVETTNYRTVRLPSDAEVPLFVKNDFGHFYKAMFGQQVKRQDMRTVFLEYAWDMSWCDPCAADPLSADELQQLGVFWTERRGPRPDIMPGAQNVFLSRLHLRYDSEHFPEDLVFQETADRENFQGRYILRHPWTGKDSCEA